MTTRFPPNTGLNGSICGAPPLADLPFSLCRHSDLTTPAGSILHSLPAPISCLAKYRSKRSVFLGSSALMGTGSGATSRSGRIGAVGTDAAIFLSGSSSEAAAVSRSTPWRAILRKASLLGRRLIIASPTLVPANALASAKAPVPSTTSAGQPSFEISESTHPAVGASISSKRKPHPSNSKPIPDGDNIVSPAAPSEVAGILSEISKATSLAPLAAAKVRCRSSKGAGLGGGTGMGAGNAGGGSITGW